MILGRRPRLVLMATAILCACSNTEETATQELGKTQQAVSHGTAEMASLPELRGPVDQGSLHRPDVKGSALPPNGLHADKCPTEKTKRADLETLEAAKESYKDSNPRDPTNPPSTPSPEALEAQSAFFKAFEARRAEFDAMSPDVREASYSEFKRQLLEK